MTSERQYDVAILGGGLAGLTLALQLKRARPETSIVVAEKQPHPVPEAAHKVGESSVENGAHYFAEILGLKEMLEREQLPKLGLRFFFPAGDNSDITRRVEVGQRQFPPVPSYQLDRGRFENALGHEVKKLGVEFIDSCKVEDVALGSDQHSVRLVRDGQELELRSRWVVDASGRAAILKRQLGLEKKNDHNASAAWFRMGERIKVDDWSDDPAWRAQVPSGERWLSTNHLMGQGYWVWLIPLSSGVTSVGIVVDAALHPFDQINTFERALEWLRRHEPQCAHVIEERREKLQDFRVLKHYSHGCERVFSADRWCLTGEAGAFLDPFYSPGSDFIASSNTFITDLIVRELGGEDIRRRTEAHQRSYFGQYELSMTNFLGQYPMWGNTEVMLVKTLWDYTAYWAVASLLFFKNKFCDLPFTASIGSDLFRFTQLARRMQVFLREWHDLTKDRPEPRDSFIEQRTIQFMYRLHEELLDELDDDGLRQRISRNVDHCEAVAVEIFRKAAPLVAKLSGDEPVDPYAISLKPERWEADRLFGPSGNRGSAEVAAELEKVLSQLEHAGSGAA